MSDAPHANITLKDIAKRVGVSAMTVSRALSGKAHLVNAETVRKCREVAEAMGYVPNLMARSLRGEQLSTIVVFAEFISSHHYLAELVDTVARSIEQRKHGVISCQSTVSLVQALRHFKLAGAVIIAPPEQLFEQYSGPHATARFREPAVVLHSAVDQSVFNEVSPDIAGFAYLATTHLLELGHTRVGYLGGPRAEDEPNWFLLRKTGIERALHERGLPASHLRHQPCPDAGLAPAALQQLLARSPDTMAVMCINDECAVAAMTGAEKLGKRVPQDLSIVGCNNIKLAGFFRPALTTLAIDIRSMVETALDLLFEDMRVPPDRRRKEPVKILLPASLVVRESTAPPRKTS